MLMAKRDKSLSEIAMFEHAQLRNARAIREAINSTEFSFDDFLKILHQAEAKGFKTWLRTSNPDAGLLDEYYKAISADSWIGKLPSKIARFFLVTGMGIAFEAIHPSGLSTAAGAAIGP